MEERRLKVRKEIKRKQGEESRLRERKDIQR